MADSLLREIVASVRKPRNPTVPAIRAIRRVWTQKLSAYPPETILALSVQLLRQDDPAFRFLAYELIHYHPAILQRLRDDMVIKALSWALRELAKHDPAAVRKFLQSHEHVLAARVRREVTAKLASVKKNPSVHNRSR